METIKRNIYLNRLIERRENRSNVTKAAVLRKYMCFAKRRFFVIIDITTKKD